MTKAPELNSVESRQMIWFWIQFSTKLTQHGNSLSKQPPFSNSHTMRCFDTQQRTVTIAKWLYVCRARVLEAYLRRCHSVPMLVLFFLLWIMQTCAPVFNSKKREIWTRAGDCGMVWPDFFCLLALLEDAASFLECGNILFFRFASKMMVQSLKMKLQDKVIKLLKRSNALP